MLQSNKLNIAQFISYPLLNQIPQRLAELNPQQETVVICHHGMRSQQACMYLVHSGFEHISNLSGGIDAWSLNCDSSVPRY